MQRKEYFVWFKQKHFGNWNQTKIKKYFWELKNQTKYFFLKPNKIFYYACFLFGETFFILRIKVTAQKEDTLKNFIFVYVV